MKDQSASRGEFNRSQDHACMKSCDVSILRVLLSDRNLHGDTGPKSGYKRTWNETFFKKAWNEMKTPFDAFFIGPKTLSNRTTGSKMQTLGYQISMLGRYPTRSDLPYSGTTIKSPWSGHPHFSGEMQLPGWRIAFTAVSCRNLGQGLGFTIGINSSAWWKANYWNVKYNTGDV